MTTAVEQFLRKPSLLGFAKLAFRLVIVPEFVGQPVHQETAFVTERLTPHEAGQKGLRLKHHLKVEFCKYQDPQTVYPIWWKKREAYVPVSKRLFGVKPVTVDTFFQLSRRSDSPKSARVWLVK